jgi:heparanase 1
VTDAFVSAFWYLDNMATLAKHGHKRFCRQTLLGGNYGLLNHTSYEPNPVRWRPALPWALPWARPWAR